MAYTPTQWINGQPPALNAENLNNMEAGILDANVMSQQAAADINDITVPIVEILEGTKTTRKYIAYNKVVSDISNDNYYIKEYTVTAGERLTVSGSGDFFLLIFQNASNEVIESYPETYDTHAGTENYTDITIIVPPNAIKMVVNGFSVGSYVQINVTKKSGVKIEGIENVKSVPSLSEIVDGTDTGRKYIDYRGIIGDIANDNYHVVTTENITPGDKLHIYCSSLNMNYAYVFYDSNSALISGKAETTTGDHIIDEYVTVPQGAVKLAVAYTASKTYGACIEKIISSVIVPHDWSSLKWSVIGDSLSAFNAAANRHYFDFIKDRTFINVTNYGLGGTGYKWAENQNNAFYQVANRIADSDIVTIWGSGNDVRSELTLGAYTDRTTATVAGCINKTLDNIFARFPKAHVGIIAPTPWANSPTTTPDNSLERYANVLKQIAEFRGVPFLDLYHHSGLRPEDVAQASIFYSNEVIDGYSQAVHPNNKGQHFLYPKFYAFIAAMLGV